MCLVLLALDTVPGYPVVLAANRDEQHARPAEPLHWWPDRPDMAAGRDTRAGGTWLGVRRDGRYATVLNAPDGAAPAAAPSRGDLVPAFLAAPEPAAAAARIRDAGDRHAGFHFLGGIRGRAWYVRRGDPAVPVLGAGLHGVDNAGLDIGDPRLGRARDGFAAAAVDPDAGALLRLLADDADPGRGHGDDRPVFIRDPVFGTRCSTVLRISDGGAVELVERRYGADGEPGGETRLAWQLDATATGAG